MGFEVQEDENTEYTPTCGVYTTEAEIEVVVLGFFLISQVMDRLHKKAFILEYIDT